MVSHTALRRYSQDLNPDVPTLGQVFSTIVFQCYQKQSIAGTIGEEWFLVGKLLRHLLYPFNKHLLTTYDILVVGIMQRHTECILHWNLHTGEGDEHRKNKQMTLNGEASWGDFLQWRGSASEGLGGWVRHAQCGGATVALLQIRYESSAFRKMD